MAGAARPVRARGGAAWRAAGAAAGARWEGAGARRPGAGAGSRGGEQGARRVQRGPARAAILSSPFRTSKHEEILMWEQTH